MKIKLGQTVGKEPTLTLLSRKHIVMNYDLERSCKLDILLVFVKFRCIFVSNHKAYEVVEFGTYVVEGLYLLGYATICKHIS